MYRAEQLSFRVTTPESVSFISNEITNVRLYNLVTLELLKSTLFIYFFLNPASKLNYSSATQFVILKKMSIIANITLEIETSFT